MAPFPRTHEVLNQATPLEGYNVFGADRVLAEALQREGGGWATEQALALGAKAGGEAIRWGFEANENPPKLKLFDRFGHRIDSVEFHPAYHSLMKLGVEAGVHALPWTEQRPGAHVARAALFMTLTQAEAGVGCPLSMTYSSVPALRAQPEVAAEWEAKITSREYDGALKPASEKRGALCGMAMTEKQGGSDVRANTTRAAPLSARGPGQAYELTGHKWFCSAPMCDAFLTLAQTEAGLSCFFLPRFLPDGSKNRIALQRLKDKLGNRSNASSEIELQGAWARLLGEEGRGVATILEMVSHTRLDCVIGGAASMRLAVSQATHHASQRAAFGKRLIEQPLMQNVLADLCVESEAATVLMMRLARAYDEAPKSAEQKLFARVATAVSKYWVCKRTAPHAAEALECHGGNGYVEESVMPRLYREAPLNSIWEGSGNVICLDVLRAASKEPGAIETFLNELETGKGLHPDLDRARTSLRESLRDMTSLEARARRLVERMALVLQGTLLLRHGSPATAEAFCRTRLGSEGGLAFGTLPPETKFADIIERANPS